MMFWGIKIERDQVGRQIGSVSRQLYPKKKADTHSQSRPRAKTH